MNAPLRFTPIVAAQPAKWAQISAHITGSQNHLLLSLNRDESEPTASTPLRTAPHRTNTTPTTPLLLLTLHTPLFSLLSLSFTPVVCSLSPSLVFSVSLFFFHFYLFHSPLTLSVSLSLPIFHQIFFLSLSLSLILFIYSE